MTKDEVAAALDEIGTLLELKGESTFRTRAYHTGARVISQFSGDLKQLIADGKLGDLQGIGEKTQQRILEGVQFLGTVGERVLFSQAYPLGLALLERLKALPGVIRAELCGSLRRRRETAKDIDILLSSDDPQPIMDAFVAFPEVMQVTGHGPTKSSVVAALPAGKRRVVLNADLRIVEDSQFPV